MRGFNNIYVLDWIINKPIRLLINKDIKIQPGEKILYTFKTENGNIETNVGIVLGYKCNSEKQGKFLRKFTFKDKKYFENLEKKAETLFIIFKKDFNSFFSEAVPVTARFIWSGKKIYFYFYCEDRLDFRDFLKVFRPKIKLPFFLYQVGARDWIRLDPRSKNCYGCCGVHILCCVQYKCPLPSVETELVDIENLSHRGLDKLRGRCNKLKCCLNYEKDIYFEELKRYPKIGDKFVVEDKQFICQAFNIMTGQVIAKDEEGQIFYFDIKDIRTNAEFGN